MPGKFYPFSSLAVLYSCVVKLLLHMAQVLCISELMKYVNCDCPTRNLLTVKVIFYRLKLGLVYTYPDKA